MKSTVLIIACTLQSVFRATSCSDFFPLTIEVPKEEIEITPTGINELDISGPSGSDQVKSHGKAFRMIQGGESSPAKQVSTPTGNGRITPLEALLNSHRSATVNGDRFKPIGDKQEYGSDFSSSEDEDEGGHGTSCFKSVSSATSKTGSDLDELDEEISKLTEAFQSENNAVSVSKDLQEMPLVYVETVESDDSDNEKEVKKAESFDNGEYEETDSIFLTPKVKNIPIPPVSEVPSTTKVTNPVSSVDEVISSTTKVPLSSSPVAKVPFVASAVENVPINLFDPRTVEDIIAISNNDKASLSSRFHLYTALSDQIFKSLDFTSPVKLSHLPPALFLLKLSMEIRRIGGKLLSAEELRSTKKLRAAISECGRKSMIIETWVSLIEDLFRAGLEDSGKHFLYGVVVPYIHHLEPKEGKGNYWSPHGNFLLNLAVKGHVLVMRHLLENESTAFNLRSHIKISEASIILGNIFRNGCVSDEEAMAIMKLLIGNNMMKSFIKEYGPYLLENIVNKRGEEIISILSSY